MGKKPAVKASKRSTTKAGKGGGKKKPAARQARPRAHSVAESMRASDYAARAAKARATRASTQASIASGQRSAAARKGVTAKRRQRQLELPKGKPRSSLVTGLERVLDVMRAYAPGAALSTREIAGGGSGFTPWSIAGKISGVDLTYPELYDALEAIAHDPQVSRAIGDRTLARMQVGYRGPKRLGGRDRQSRNWTVGEIAPWDVLTSRAMSNLDPDDDDSIGARYSEGDNGSTAASLTIWLSSSSANNTGVF